ncbi:MAG: class I SAM-dependent methyltransferase [Candidatus Aminicenantes bacterium]|nr:class I SAM-dependent methyltransferase [Candidatus Aminicenantes bacterium]
MPHTFDAARFKRLMSAERRQELPPRPILEKIGLHPGQVFVDIGAGPGFFAIPAAEIVGPRGRVFGLDIAPVMAEELRKNAARKRAANIRVGIIPKTAAKLPPGADFYFLANVFHEVDDRKAYLRNIRRHMSASSRLVIIDYLKKKTKRGPRLSHRVPLKALRALLVETGFVVERIFRPNEMEYAVIARPAAGGHR